MAEYRYRVQLLSGEQRWLARWGPMRLVAFIQRFLAREIS
jgi:hypothetical protein